MADTPAWFVESDYLTSKLNQLKELNNDQYGEWTEDDVAAAIEAAGMTPFQHFEGFSGNEGTSPNAYFNVAEYLTLKAAQMNREAEGGRSNWEPAEVAAAISGAGMSAWTHFQNFGWKEGVSPSNSFDVEAYFEDKLAQLQEAGEDYENVDQVKAVFAEAGLDPVAHYYAFGAAEGLEPKVTKFLDDLTTALDERNDAIDARDDFLDAAAEELGVEGADDPENPTEQEIRDAIGNAVEAAQDDLTDISSTAEGGKDYNYVDASADVVAAMIADDRAGLAAELKKAEEGVAGATGLKTALNSVISAQARAEQAEDAAEDAGKAALGEKAKTAALNAVEFVEGGEDDDFVLGYVVTDEDDEDVTLHVIVRDANGKLKLGPAGEAEDFENAAALLAAMQASEDADAALYARSEALAKAIIRVVNDEGAATYDAVNGDDYEPYTYNGVFGIDPEDEDAELPTQVELDEYIANFVSYEGDEGEEELVWDFTDDGSKGTGERLDDELAQTYLEAHQAVQDFEEAVTAYGTANDLVAGLEEADEAVADADAVIEGLGYNLVEFEDGQAEGTEETDVFVYTGVEDETFEGQIDLFAEVGADVLYIGEGYTFNDDIENGDNTALEVFFTQQGEDVLVSIEHVEFGSNAATPEVDTILLTGLSVEDLTFDQGYVQFIG